MIHRLPRLCEPSVTENAGCSLVGWRLRGISCLQSMLMTWCTPYFTLLLLTADWSLCDPVIFHHLVHSRPLLRIYFQHSSNDVTALSGKYPKQSPGSFDRFALDRMICRAVLLPTGVFVDLFALGLAVTVMMVVVVVVVGGSVPFVPGSRRARLGRQP